MQIAGAMSAQQIDVVRWVRLHQGPV
jgi:hypothetical protein